MVGDSLLYISNACFACKLYVETDKLRLKLRAWKADEFSNIFIDIKSFYGSKAPKNEIAIVHSGVFVSVKLTPADSPSSDSSTSLADVVSESSL